MMLSLKLSTHTDSDGLSAILLKNCTALTIPLGIIFNKSLTTGTFLDEWKLSIITPFFKSGRKNDVRNYRPISKLSSISKLFECIIKDKIYFAVKSLINPNQHGFVTGRSTTTNLAVFSEYCMSSFSKGVQVDCIYTDFSKAFDKVSHAILINKLACLGFHSTILQWLKSYLMDRRCVVKIDGVLSKQFVATSGVPQGSILGPLLFVIFINDISKCFSFSNFLLFADDLKIFSSIKDSVEAQKLQLDLNNLHRWCLRSRLSLNIKKCFHLTFSRRQFIFNSSYTISNNVLQSVTEFKDLGVLFDTKFSFSGHVNFILSKSYSILSFIRRNAFEFSDPYTLKLLFTALVRSHLEYAVIIWRPYDQLSIKRIERVQKIFLKQALRSLRFESPVPSYNSRLKLINLETLEKRRTVLSLSFIFNVVNNIVDCPALLERINFNVPHRSLRNFYPFYGDIFKTKFASNAPIARALRDYNLLSNSSLLDFALSRSNFVKILKLVA